MQWHCVNYLPHARLSSPIRQPQLSANVKHHLVDPLEQRGCRLDACLRVVSLEEPLTRLEAISLGERYSDLLNLLISS